MIDALIAGAFGMILGLVAGFVFVKPSPLRAFKIFCCCIVGLTVGVALAAI